MKLILSYFSIKARVTVFIELNVPISFLAATRFCVYLGKKNLFFMPSLQKQLYTRHK